MEQLRETYPHLSDAYLTRLLQRGYGNASANYLNNMVIEVLSDLTFGVTPSNFRLNSMLDDVDDINPTSFARFTELLDTVGLVAAAELPGPARTVGALDLGTYYIRDRSKAIAQKEFVNDVDPVSLEHIVDYYYVCENGHAFEMNSILDYCREGVRFGRNCKACSVCRGEMKSELYKQPEILTEIKQIVFDDLIVTDELYDPERIDAIMKLFEQLSHISTASIIKETAHYKKQTNQV